MGGFVRVLNGAACDGYLADGTTCGVEPDVGAGRAFFGVISFNITGANVQVPHIASVTDHAATRIVADVTADDVGLMKIDVIVKHSDASVVIKVTVGDQYIPISIRQMHGVSALAHDETAEGDLHGACGLDAISFGMIADDFEALDHRGALFFPNIRFHRIGGCCASVSAHEMECGPGSRHHDSRRAVARESGKARLIKINLDGAGQSVFSFREEKGRIPFVHGFLDRRRIIGQAIANSSHGSNVGLGL